MKLYDDWVKRAEALRQRFEKRQGRALSELFRPAYSRPEIMKLFDPLVAAAAAAALVGTSALAFAAFGVLLACAFLAWLIITQVFGIQIELDPDMLNKFAPS